MCPTCIVCCRRLYTTKEKSAQRTYFHGGPRGSVIEWGAQRMGENLMALPLFEDLFSPDVLVEEERKSGGVGICMPCTIIDSQMNRPNSPTARVVSL
jgi:hypothetical protein